MKTTMVRYKVKPDRIEDNKAYIERVFEELSRTRLAGLQYASFQLEDGVSFVHIATMEKSAGENPLTGTPAFQAFIADIKDRCDEPPVAVDLESVGSYRFFGD